MMSNISEKALIAYGLNKKEAKIYLASLALGLATVRELSGKSGLKRTTIYSLADVLKTKGIIQVVARRGKIYYSAVDPQYLYERMEKRTDLFRGALPKLADFRNKSWQRPQVIFYEGTEGFKQLWRDIFSSGIKEYLIITSGKEFLTFVSESYLKNKIIAKKIALGIKSKQIITDSRYAREIIKNDFKENRVSKLIASGFFFPATEIIFGDKAAIFTGRFENIIMLIESEEISKTHRAYFEFIWSKS